MERLWGDHKELLTTMIYLIFKSINSAPRVGVSNLKDKIYKLALAKFVNNVQELLDGMSSNNSIVLDKG